ncbi:hypothetical protein [Lysinibacillus sp. NPDC056185]|uniref:hypothetical protein n=1 Tax=Lysinibacillus sp. NPDC056185 TaxID=3345739 RepID=UPI0039F0FD83
MNSDAPDYIRGRSIYDVADDLIKKNLHPDQLPVTYFVDPKTGLKVAESNRTLATLALADMKPTVLNEIQPTAEVLDRLNQKPIRHKGVTYNMPGNAVPVTPGQNNLTVKNVIKLPCEGKG